MRFHPILFLLLWICLIPDLYAQKHDYTWMFGYNLKEHPDPTTWGFDLLFTETPPSMTLRPGRSMFIDQSHAAISDTAGHLQFYYNGCEIHGPNDSLMENGDGLNPGDISDLVCPENYNTSQDVVILPHPDSVGLYDMFHHSTTIFTLTGGLKKIDDDRLHRTRVNMKANQGLGKVSLKNEVLQQDTFSSSLAAVRHTNGHDWWIIHRGQRNNFFYTFLYSGDSITGPFPQEIGIPFTGANGSAYALFSPQGDHFAISQWEIGCMLFDMDRSTGELSNLIHLPIPMSDTIRAMSCAFSPSGRYLYVAAYFEIYQYDLEAIDIAASQKVVVHYDYTLCGLQTAFYWMQLGPDCKIYVIAPNGIRCMSVMHYPDNPVPDCGFSHNEIFMPTYNGISLPYYPNYRLGNAPVCDSSISVHIIPHIPVTSEGLKVIPNPTSGRITLTGLTDGSAYDLQLMDLTGREMATWTGQFSPIELDLSPWPNGLYFLVIDGLRSRETIRLIKTE